MFIDFCSWLIHVRLINLRSYLLYLISLVTQLVYYTVGKWEGVGVFMTEYNILVEKLGSCQWVVLNMVKKPSESILCHFLPNGIFLSLFRLKLCILLPNFPMHATCPVCIFLLDLVVCWRPQIITIHIAVPLLPPLGPTVILSTLFSPLILLLPLLEKQVHIHKN